MDQKEILSIFKKVGAVITNDHFIYTSGNHGATYVNKDALYPHTRIISALARLIAEHFKTYRAETVIGPAVGGVILAQWTAHHLTELTRSEVAGVYADKTSDSGFIIQRGYDILCKERRVLVVEDIVTTGRSVQKVVEAARATGGTVVGVGILCNRGGMAAEDLTVPEVYALTHIPVETFTPDTCPLCKKGIVINRKLGKGKGLSPS